MKKLLLLLLTGILSITLFAGCNNGTVPAEPAEQQRTDRYKRELIFDKEKLDTEKAAWETSGIKNYQFTLEYEFIDPRSLLKKITVRDGKLFSTEYYYSSSEYMFIDDVFNPEYYGEPADIEKIKKEDPSFYEFFFETSTFGQIKTINDVYAFIEKEYEEAKKIDLKEERIVKYVINSEYYDKYHVPFCFDSWILTERDLEEGLSVGDFCGWECMVLDFKVIE